jgi:hypothetical protein
MPLKLLTYQGGLDLHSDVVVSSPHATHFPAENKSVQKFVSMFVCTRANMCLCVFQVRKYVLHIQKCSAPLKVNY